MRASGSWRGAWGVARGAWGVAGCVTISRHGLHLLSLAWNAKGVGVPACLRLLLLAAMLNMKISHYFTLPSVPAQSPSLSALCAWLGAPGPRCISVPPATLLNCPAGANAMSPVSPRPCLPGACPPASPGAHPQPAHKPAVLSQGAPAWLRGEQGGGAREGGAVVEIEREQRCRGARMRGVEEEGRWTGSEG